MPPCPADERDASRLYRSETSPCRRQEPCTLASREALLSVSPRTGRPPRSHRSCCSCFSPEEFAVSALRAPRKSLSQLRAPVGHDHELVIGLLEAETKESSVLRDTVAGTDSPINK